jgi:hypothetical protein
MILSRRRTCPTLDDRPRRRLGRPWAVPVFTAVHSIEEEPDSAPAASPCLRGRIHGLPEVGFTNPGKFPSLPARDAPLPAQIRQIRAGQALRGFTTPVPTYSSPSLLTGPTPSGSADAPRLCRGCSHRHLPARAAPASTGCCDSPQVQVSHLQSNGSASRRTKPALDAFTVTFPGRIPRDCPQLHGLPDDPV